MTTYTAIILFNRKNGHIQLNRDAGVMVRSGRTAADIEAALTSWSRIDGQYVVEYEANGQRVTNPTLALDDVEADTINSLRKSWMEEVKLMTGYYNDAYRTPKRPCSGMVTRITQAIAKPVSLDGRDDRWKDEDVPE